MGSSLVEGDQPEKIRITAEEWAAKARDKPECYHKVAHTFGIYVPHMDQVTTWHLRDLATGVKKAIKSQQVQHLHVPQYERLGVDDFIKLIDDHPFVQMRLPDQEHETRKLGR